MPPESFPVNMNALWWWQRFLARDYGELVPSPLSRNYGGLGGAMFAMLLGTEYEKERKICCKTVCHPLHFFLVLLIFHHQKWVLRLILPWVDPAKGKYFYVMNILPILWVHFRFYVELKTGKLTLICCLWSNIKIFCSSVKWIAGYFEWLYCASCTSSFCYLVWHGIFQSCACP